MVVSLLSETYGMSVLSEVWRYLHKVVSLLSDIWWMVVSLVSETDEMSVLLEEWRYLPKVVSLLSHIW